MSVEELLARISQLSADIETQKEVLRQLERDKSAAQRQLNALRDPIALLPLELSSKIFLHCLPPFPSPALHAALMLLMNICNTWIDIALSTPTLWATIYIHPRLSSPVEVLQSWLPRARHCPLSISIQNDRLNSDAATVFQQYAPQLKHLVLYDQMPEVDPSTSFAFLETLTIDSFGANDWKLGDLVRLFELTPNLVRCTLPNVDVRTSRSDHDLPIVILPNLHSLEFGDSVVRDGLTTGNDLLRHLTLPALETLAVPLYVASFDDFSLFLRRSAPPLRSLLLGCGLYKIRFPQLHECLRLLPSLTHFDLCAPFAALDADLFAALVDSEFLLPNLQSLKIQSQALFHHSSLHQTVLQVLSARHPQLVCFHLCTKQHRPDTEILDGLRQLAADGMEIFIGKSWKKNYMSI